MNNSIEPQIISVNWLDRWQVYNRLKALEIECLCQTNQPLEVYPDNPQAIIQIWSVVKQLTAPRQELIDWLNQCWEIKSSK